MNAGGELKISTTPTIGCHALSHISKAKIYGKLFEAMRLPHLQQRIQRLYVHGGLRPERPCSC